MTLVVEARAPGKLVLLGEYAVRHGAPALVLATQRSVRVRISPGNRGVASVNAPDMGVFAARFAWQPGAKPVDQDGAARSLPLVGSVLDWILTTLHARGHTLSGGAVIDIDTTAFVHPTRGKLGLGSSAALTVALVAGLSGFVCGERRSLNRRQIFADAFNAHAHAQGKAGSGIDVAASVHGGLGEFRRHPRQPLPDHTRLSMRRFAKAPPWLTVFSGVPASTPRLLGTVDGWAQRSNANRALHDTWMATMARTSEHGIACLRRGDLSGFATAAAAYGQHMTHLGDDAGADIASMAHRRIGDLVRAVGGVYKPSGAGGGDLGLVICQSFRDLRRVHGALSRACLHVVPITIAAEGVGLAFRASPRPLWR